MMFGPSPDGFSDGPLLRGPTDDEVQTAMDVLRWAGHFSGNQVTWDVMAVQLHSLVSEAEGK